MTAKAKRGIKFVAWIISIGLFVTTLETASYLSVGFISNAQPSLIWNANSDSWVPRIEQQQYLKDRHPVLGWPSLSQLKNKEFDALESRRNTFFDEFHKPCVSTYGDSFTWSDEVSFEHAWPNELSRLLNCRVNNFGIGGYGVDQAVLRHNINRKDQAPISILTIVPYNVYRNLNQLRSLIHGRGDPYSLKPRYIIDGNKLRIIPIPDLSTDEFHSLSSDPNRILTHEFFLPGSSYGSIPVSFPYSRFWWDLLSNKNFISRVEQLVTKKPHWWDFYRPNHPSKSLELLVELIDEFRRNSFSRNQVPLITFLPDSRSVDYFKASGSWEYQPLFNALDARGINAINLGDAYLKKLGHRSFCSILSHPTRCEGHFNEEGYLILAKIIEEILLAENLVPNNT